MRTALSNHNSDLVAQFPDYVCRVTADEGDIGRGHLSRFQDVDKTVPTILTTLKRTGILGDLISWEDGVYGTSKSVFAGGA